MAKKKKIFIWGAGGQGRVTLENLGANNEFEVIAFADSDAKCHGKIINGIEVVSGKDVFAELKKRGAVAGYVAIGDNRTRCEIAAKLKKQGFPLINAIHPKSVISQGIHIGENVEICIGAIICVNAAIEDNVLINSGAIIEHDDIIKNGVHVAPGAKLAGGVTIGEKAFIGIGSVVIPYCKIGKNAVIGAGAVVISDIPDNAVAVGNPAKVIKYITDDSKINI